ncbi:MAG: peptide chain release factor N(5)-glutamine methyltransferase [Oscillospiraceae bacterium]|nr:peptide chain release factor N(5)-glutamine methyltransferase [Oscillospiraceae bacterium]
MARTYNDLYLDFRRTLHAAGVEGATLEAKELVAFAAGKTKEELLRDIRLYVAPQTESYAEKLLARRLQGEPMAYLIGEWEFYGLSLDVSEAVLIPRVDTEVLAEKALEYVKGLGRCRVLDLCAGSGCVGLAIAANAPQSHVVLGEFDEKALKICRQNIRRCSLTGRAVSLMMDAREKPSPTLGEFDCIVSNPPYIPDGDIPGLDVSVRDYEPHLALRGGEDGLDFYRVIVEKWRAALTENGRMYFEVGIGQADSVMRIMRGAGFGDIEIVKDTAGIPRVVFGTLYSEI